MAESVCDREVAWSALDCHSSSFEPFMWNAVSSDSSHQSLRNFLCSKLACIISKLAQNPNNLFITLSISQQRVFTFQIYCEYKMAFDISLLCLLNNIIYLITTLFTIEKVLQKNSHFSMWTGNQESMAQSTFNFILIVCHPLHHWPSIKTTLGQIEPDDRMIYCILSQHKTFV